MLTSPELGLRVPTSTTTNRGQNADKPAKPSPVAAISKAATRSNRPSAKRCPHAPTANVLNADPSIVAVLRMPTSNVPTPIDSK
ncbi:hypothetical protein SAMN05216567_111253 [Variovorax sp. OK605]|nr:hypothetical protein SAMN05216567_111253 [Variovorax sp. OK605]